jgi:cytochrome c-type biogenesis protein CcmF
VISENNTGEAYNAEFAKEENPRENVPAVYRNTANSNGPDYTVTLQRGLHIFAKSLV